LKPIVTVVLWMLLASTALTRAQSQESPSHVEVFGGYTLLNYPIAQIHSGPWVRNEFNGWEASAAVGLVHHLSLEADFGGGSASMFNTAIKTYMGGPRISANYSKIEVFAHSLFGGLKFSSQPGHASGTSFALGLGGGINFWPVRHLGVRVAQGDYIRNTNSAAVADSSPGPQPSADFRFSTGLAVRF